MPLVTSLQPLGNLLSGCAPSGAFGANTMMTGVALPGGSAVLFSYIENISSATPLFVSFGAPVSATQFNLVLFPSGAPFTDRGMIQTPIYVSGGPYVAWSM